MFFTFYVVQKKSFFFLFGFSFSAWESALPGCGLALRGVGWPIPCDVEVSPSFSGVGVGPSFSGVGVGPSFSGLGLAFGLGLAIPSLWDWLALPFKEKRRRPGSTQKGRGGPTPEERRANPHSQKRKGHFLIKNKKLSITITIHKIISIITINFTSEGGGKKTRVGISGRGLALPSWCGVGPSFLVRDWPFLLLGWGCAVLLGIGGGGGRGRREGGGGERGEVGEGRKEKGEERGREGEG